MAALILVVLGAAVSSLTPLTDAQRAQLDTAEDFTQRFDTAALYPLLHNAAQWTPGDEAGAAVPDYGQIQADPKRHRGEAFLIEGLFAGVPEGETLRIRSLSRPGPWDGKLEQWVVVVDPDSEADEVAVVYLTDPPPHPREGTRVRMPARFYKVLDDFDRSPTPRPTQYLTFVGRGAEVLGSSLHILGGGGAVVRGAATPVLDALGELPGTPDDDDGDE